MHREPEIYCPKCEYHPVAEDRWDCIPSCGTTWHTFWTGGVCPGCRYQWTVTQCPACDELSPHKDWYHYPEGEKSDTEEKTDIHEPANTQQRVVDRGQTSPDLVDTLA